MSRILDTRDLNKRKEELEALRDAVTEAEEALREAKESFGDSEREEPAITDEGTEAWDEWSAENDTLEEAVTDAESALEVAISDFSDDEKEELAELENLESEIGEWRHGEAMIPESEFTDYIMETLEDCGTLPKDLPWYIAIDRDETAENCKADYSEVEYQKATYLVRNC